VVLRTDALGRPTTYALDALNRLTAQESVDGTRHTFTFDAAGRQVSMGIRAASRPGRSTRLAACGR